MVVILSEDAIPAVRMSVDEYLEADLPEGHRYELVDGVVEITPTPDPLHDSVVGVLSEAFILFRRAHASMIAHISQRAAVTSPVRATVRGPDLALYRQWDRHRRDVGAWKELTPFLVVEVISPGQRQRDLVEKRDDYWAAGIRGVSGCRPECRSADRLPTRPDGVGERDVRPAAGDVCTGPPARPRDRDRGLVR